MSTFMAKKGEVPQRWFVVDATDQVVGRLAVQIANVLRGKHRPEYTPHQDTGEYVIVINADKVRFTGKKWQTKVYRAYSHHAGGLKQVVARDVLENRPERIIYEAVKRMVPRNRLGRHQMTKLKIYRSPADPKQPAHPHQAQKPEVLKLST
jgi:large subunit ribosomal protein L13